MASTSRAIHPDEVRQTLQSLQAALRDRALPFVIPKFPTQAGRKMLPKYAANATVARRGVALQRPFA